MLLAALKERGCGPMKILSCGLSKSLRGIPNDATVAGVGEPNLEPGLGAQRT
jgi:hypothetical protein